MYYSSIGILGLLILLINNYDIFKISVKNGATKTELSYRNFLYSVIAYYILDVLWEGLYALKLNKTIFIETTLYFIVMAGCVLLWTQYIINYLNVKKRFLTLLNYSGKIFFILQAIILAVNFFVPIAFWFDSDCVYQTGIARMANLYIQFVFFLTTSIYMMIFTFRLQGRIKKRYRSIWSSSLIMTVFVVLQVYYPFMPFYAVGFLLATSLIHSFVQEDERENHREELEKLIQIENIQEAELGSARLMAYRDPLTGVKNKNAYLEDMLGIEMRIKDKKLADFGIVVFDVNGLKTVNDTEGHEEGDKFIKAATKIICLQFKHSPIYRIGGDEFVAFLLGDDFKKREELFKSFARTIENNKKEGKVVIANGFANFDELKEKTYKALFELADKRMYERKRELKENF